jgi:predicted RNase H-like HicB family nuclease
MALLNKTLDYYMALPYTVTVEQNEDGWFAKVEELQGCMTEADSEDMVRERIKEAMEAWIGVSLKEGLPIPEPAN